MSNLGSLVVELSANIAKFQSDLGKAAAIAEQRMAQIDKAVGMVKTTLGALGVGFAFGATFDTIKGKIEGVIESTAGLQQLSERTNSSAEALSGLVGIAKLSGTSSDDLATALQKLAKSMVDAENGGKKTSASFAAIGISTQDLKNKKPDEVFKLVADRLALYQDGAEKSTIAQNLLGKSGANLLPVMKDLAEAGELQVKATQEQIEAADELEKNQIRLHAASDAIFKKIGLELVPVYNAFTKALLASANANDGIRKSVSDLAGDGSIREWAETAAKVVGFVVDAFDGVVRTVQIVGKAIGASIASIAALGEGGGIMSKAGRDAFKAVWQGFDDEAQGILNKTLFSERLRQQLEAAHSQAGAGKSPRMAINGSGLTPDDAEIKRYTSALQALEQQLGKLNNQSEAEKVIYQTTEGSLKSLTQAHKAHLLAVAGEIDQRNVRIAVLDSEQAHFTALYNVIQQGEEIRKNAALAARAQVQAYEFETSLLGKSTVEAAQLNAERQIALNLQSQLRAAAAAYRNDNAGYEKEAARLEAIATALREQLIPQIKARIELERSAAFGTSEALRKYSEAASNGAQQMESLYTNAFKNMEDALVSFVRNGQVDFSKLIDSMISDLIRFEVQQSITGPLAAAMKSEGGLGGLLSSIFSSGGTEVAGARAAGGPVSAGLPYLVGEHGPEILVPDTAGKVIPNGGGLGGGGITFAPVIKIDARSDRADVYANVQRALQHNNEQFAGMLRQQGVLV